MQVIVTRPAHEAQDWAARLRERRFDAVALPLIDIAPAADPEPLRQAWRDISCYAAVMFVSGNAVREFFRAQPAGCSFTPRAWAPGPGTGDALLAAGVDRARIAVPAHDAEQFDSEALWAQVKSSLRPGDAVLIVRGGDGEGRGKGREWLSAQIAQSGAEARDVAAYRRAVPQWSEAERHTARGASVDALWLFSSSEAVANLAVLVPGQDWSRARALATHPRIAQAAREAGFGVVAEARPAFEAVVTALESAG